MTNRQPKPTLLASSENAHLRIGSLRRLQQRTHSVTFLKQNSYAQKQQLWKPFSLQTMGCLELVPTLNKPKFPAKSNRSRGHHSVTGRHHKKHHGRLPRGRRIRSCG